MKKNILFILLLFTSMATFAGNDYAKYYQGLPKPMPTVVAPTIPDNNVSIIECGGIGDGITMNTIAFQKAISKLSKLGGGHLNVPAGIYLTGLISLKDNIDLHIERNAMILLSPDKKDHFKTEDGATDNKPTPGINASNRKNISITGEGTIDGNGKWWRAAKHSKVSDTEWNQFKLMGGTISANGELWYPYNLKNFDNIANSAEAQENIRTHLIRFTSCENVLIQGVTIQNSPKFHIVPQRCNNVIIDGVTVRCPWNAQNGDGIDVGNCSNVLIINNTIDAGDDGICMKGGAGKSGLEYGPCENINIQDNKVYHAHGGFVIGSEFSGGMKNIFVNNNTFSGTDTGLRFKSSIGRGGTTESINISNIYMNDIKDDAIVFETTYSDNPVGAKKQSKTTAMEFVPDFKDIHISNIICRDVKNGITAHGEKGMIHDITIENSTIFYTNKAKDIDTDCDIKLVNVKLVTYPAR